MERSCNLGIQHPPTESETSRLFSFLLSPHDGCQQSVIAGGADGSLPRLPFRGEYILQLCAHHLSHKNCRPLINAGGVDGGGANRGCAAGAGDPGDGSDPSGGATGGGARGGSGGGGNGGGEAGGVDSYCGASPGTAAPPEGRRAATVRACRHRPERPVEPWGSPGAELGLWPDCSSRKTISRAWALARLQLDKAQEPSLL